jgi:hypothetical protein
MTGQELMAEPIEGKRCCGVVSPIPGNDAALVTQNYSWGFTRSTLDWSLFRPEM